MSYELRRLADRRLPNFEDENKLASSVEEFTNCLMDPLKSDVKCRLQFKQCFDEVMETAVELGQKKVGGYKSCFRYLEASESEYHQLHLPVNAFVHHVFTCRQTSEFQVSNFEVFPPKT